MINLYAIKIDNKYFKEYMYYDKDKESRYAGHGTLDSKLKDGDIIDIVLTDNAERTETKRSIGNTIGTIYTIEKFKNKELTIIPVKE